MTTPDLREAAAAFHDWWENGWGAVEGTSPEYTCMTVTENERGDELAQALGRALQATGEPPFGWHNDGDECIGPHCINMEHDEAAGATGEGK